MSSRPQEPLEAVSRKHNGVSSFPYVFLCPSLRQAVLSVLIYYRCTSGLWNKAHSCVVFLNAAVSCFSRPIKRCCSIQVTCHSLAEVFCTSVTSGLIYGVVKFHFCLKYGQSSHVKPEMSVLGRWDRAAPRAEWKSRSFAKGKERN